MGKIRKKTSKIWGIAKRKRIEKKIGNRNKKIKKHIKKMKQLGIKPKHHKKESLIPNSYPFKHQIINAE